MTLRDKKLYNCSACGSEDFSDVHEAGSFSSKVKVAICQRCGLICINPRWDEKGYSDYYRDNYYVDTKMRKYVDDEYDIAEGGREDQIYNSIKDYIDENSSILEVGAGNGDNVIWLLNKGYYNICCIEVDQVCCNRITAHYPKVRVECKTLSDFSQANKKKFDIVLLSHVLEHFVWPEVALQSIYRLLNENGYLYALVPHVFAFQNPFNGFILSHTHYYSYKTLTLLLESNGFTQVTKTGSNHDEIAVIAQKTSARFKFSIDEDEYKRALYFFVKRCPVTKILKNKIIRFVEKVMTEDTYWKIRNTLNLQK